MTDPNTPMDEPTRAEAVERVRELYRRAEGDGNDRAVARLKLRQQSGGLAHLVVELADELAVLRVDRDRMRAGLDTAQPSDAMDGLPICGDCPIGNRAAGHEDHDPTRGPCPRTALCDRECAAESAGYDAEGRAEAMSDPIDIEDAPIVAWITGAVVDDTEPLGGGFTADPGTAQDELAALRADFADHVHALDIIRAACESAGIPGERNLPSRDREDPAPILERRSTPSLVAALVEDRDAALAQVEQLRGALLRHGRHDYGNADPAGLAECEAVRSGPGTCDCGLDDALSETPAATLEARDRRVGAEALEDAAAACDGFVFTLRGPDQRRTAAADMDRWLRERARSLREGPSPGKDTP